MKAFISVFAVLSIWILPAFAADTPADSPSDKAMKEVRQLIEAQDFAAAEAKLLQVTAEQPNKADAWNLLGFATRKQGKLDVAEGYYDKALTLDDDHTGALEYLGMLYVQTGRIEEAKGLLKRIDDACFFSCSEFDRLEKAIKDLKAY